jgi:WYL domain
VTQLELSKTTFERLDRFDAREYMAGRLPLIRSDYQIDLWIDLPLEEARRSFALWRVLMEKEGSGTRLRCGRDNLDFFAAMLLSTRRRLVVHHPAELRETFQALALQATTAAINPHT